MQSLQRLRQLKLLHLFLSTASLQRLKRHLTVEQG
jgi:hypothetical protein